MLVGSTWGNRRTWQRSRDRKEGGERWTTKKSTLKTSKKSNLKLWERAKSVLPEGQKKEKKKKNKNV